jgi:uncharacterized protein (TIGR00251 family)
MSKIISVKAVPKAVKNEVVKLDEDSYKIFVIAAPIKGQANQAIIKLLADYFQVSKSLVSITSGLKSRKKTIKIG